jgi:hypothetical protein
VRRVILGDRPPRRCLGSCRSPAHQTTRRSYWRDRMERRELRRLAGLLAVRLPEVDLEAVPDPRAREGRWAFGQILRATLVGLMAGCKSLWETEDLTSRLSTPMRRLLRLPRRHHHARCSVPSGTAGRAAGRPASDGSRGMAAQGARPGGATHRRCRPRRQGDGGAEHQRRVRPDTAPRTGVAVRPHSHGDLRPRLCRRPALHRRHPHPAATWATSRWPSRACSGPTASCFRW